MTQQSQPALNNEATNGSQSESDALPKDELFHILSSQRRRHVLRYLAEHGDRVDMRDLAEQVAAWEHDTTVENLHSDQRQRVYIGLYQVHLPKLDDYGIINYNKPRGIVERTHRADQLDQYIHRASATTSEPTPGSGMTSAVRLAAAGAVGTTSLITGWLGIISAWLLLTGTWVVIAVGIIARVFGDDH